MKTLTIAVAAALTLLATDAAMARSRRGCPGGNCYVGGAVQAPVQKAVAKGQSSPSDASKQATAETAPAAPAPVAAAPTQRTRRLAAFRLGRRN